MTAGDGADLHSMFGKGSRWSLAVWPTRENLVAGVLTGHSSSMSKLKNAADFGEVLLKQFPSFPRKWVLPISQQLAVRSPAPHTAILSCGYRWSWVPEHGPW